MKRSEIKSILLLSITSIIFLINLFLKRFINEYTIIIVLALIFIATACLLGFERSRLLRKNKFLVSILLFTLSFVVIIYGVGLVVGYTKNPYDLSIIGIIKNIVPFILMVGLSELLRYNLLKKSDDSKLIFLLVIFFFALIDISLVAHMYNLNNVQHILELSTITILPSIVKNYVLNDFSRKYGYESTIIYQIVTGIWIYILPIVPSYGIYLDSVFNFLKPLAVWYIINLIYQPDDKEDIRNKHLAVKIVTIVFTVLIVLIVGLYSNLFRYWIAVVGSGSMSPTIDVGDAIVIDKSYRKHLNKIKAGDILVFKVHDVIYTHRVTNIQENDGQYSIATKGDRKGQAQDTWKVTNDDVVGVVKLKIPYIGQPSVWLHEKMEVRKNGKRKE